ncbi:MAG: serine hydrolase domain-containing protein [Candidatus Hodarchaeota archaeon]
MKIILFLMINILSFNLVNNQVINGVSAYEWSTSTPEEYGINQSQLEKAFLKAEDISYLFSILLIRNGTLIAEKYFNGVNQNDAHHIHSITKSFTTTLVGIALQEGFLNSIDQQMLDFFPEYIFPELDPKKYNITIHHLLSMTAGFDFPETTENWIEYSSSPNWVQYVIELPLRHDPGAGWAYSTPHMNLLSAILTKATGMNTRDFAAKYLFDPLGISVDHWHQDPQGIYTGGHEMYMNPRNMARLGYLYENDGKINGLQIISKEWIETSIEDHSNGSLREWEEATGGWISITNMNYGYGWWLGIMKQAMTEYEVYFAQGLGGNFILNVPELDVVIVTTANGTIFDRGNEEEEMMNFIAQEIIPAISKEVDSQTTSSTLSREVDSQTTSSTPSKEVDSQTTSSTPSLKFIVIVPFLFLIVFLRKKKRLFE